MPDWKCGGIKAATRDTWGKPPTVGDFGLT